MLAFFFFKPTVYLYLLFVQLVSSYLSSLSIKDRQTGFIPISYLLFYRCKQFGLGVDYRVFVVKLRFHLLSGVPTMTITASRGL